MLILKNKKLTIIFIIISFLLLGLIVFYVFFRNIGIEGYPNNKKISLEECQRLGGEDINTLDYYDDKKGKFVYPPAGVCNGREFLGKITGMKCPCVCCK